MTHVFSSADRALARRIEAGHAFATMSAAGKENAQAVAGGWAVFKATGSPMTQAIGIGTNGAVEAAELDRMEAFFHQRGSPAIIDLSTLADPGVLEMIQLRGYTVKEISHVLARRLDPAEQLPA